MHEGIWQNFLSHKPSLHKFHELLGDENIMDGSLDTRERFLAKILHKHYKYKKQLPTNLEIQNYAKNGELTPDEYQMFMQFVINIKKTEPQEVSSMVRDFQIFIQHKMAENAAMEFSSLLEKGAKNPLEDMGYIGALKSIIKKIDISHYNNDVKMLDISESVSDFIIDENNTSKAISSGNEWMDMVHAGGWYPGSVVVFASEANAAKTATLIQLAINMTKNGKNGLFVSYEINRQNILKRVYSNLTEISTFDIGNHQDEIALQMRNISLGRLLVEYLPDGTSTTELESLVEKTAEKLKGKLDFIIVDYIGCMKSPNVSAKESGLYERFGAVISDLKTLADTWKCPILTAHQLNRGGYGKEDLSMANLGDSMKIAHKADAVFFIRKLKDSDNGNRYLEYTLDKSRVSGCNGASCIFRLNKNFQRLYKVSDEEVDALAIEKVNKPDVKPNNSFVQTKNFNVDARNKK